jgi:molybdate transport system regulatory protein
MTRLEVRSKVWLEVGGEPLLGAGRRQLLGLIQQCGSISAAARTMGVTYRKAWSHLQQMEKRLGFPLVARRKGGVGGGETVLTAEALALLGRFDTLQTEVQTLADRRFKEAFSTSDEVTAEEGSGSPC